MRCAKGLVLVALVVVLVAGSVVEASSIRSGFDTNTLAGNDDGWTGPVDLGFTANFFGVDYSQVYVNNNGNVTFDSGMSTYTPFNLITTGRPIIAPFFADVDTRTGNEVTYGQGTADGRDAFGVNWIDVGYYSTNTDKLNSFQLVMIDRSDRGDGDFDFEFNYGQIEWETGDASGGSGGMGGTPARVGWSNGVDTSFEQPGSAISGALIDGGPGSLSALGRLSFEARNGGVINPVPEPLTMTGILLACGVVGTRIRKRLGNG